MTERERAINKDLRVLDDAHRLGRLTRAEYRARRRRVLQSLYDGNGVVTARKTLVPGSGFTTTPHARQTHATPTSDTPMASGRALTTLLSMRPGIAWKPLLAILVGAVVLILLAYWLLHGK
ncbi:hypothetical protein GCM10008098_04380 [Rhodanobacter panaciterrae]|uniref:DUF1707 domain-containing protein n=1 Tax=Rhodanobacter panaciterrae TaxID=490572 RepID=A0ABQ2ZL80_9GAMM|nr:hypothetical protein [Rhodanobacter panaciterrae]GGY16251.1 hypothetical protein GCM10008098_04380 [Rhodanobacter panaciterrae]